MDLKMEIIWCTKKINQITNFYRGQISRPVSLKFEIMTNDYEMQWNWTRWLKMTYEDHKRLSLENGWEMTMFSCMLIKAHTKLSNDLANQENDQNGWNRWSKNGWHEYQW